MAKLRSASAYRRIKRPHTRHSKKRSKAYIKGAPNIKIVHYDMGNLTTKFPYEIQLIAKKDINLRENAIEAARQAANKFMNTKAKGNFAIKIRAVPHNVMRENPLATGAGADRFSRGMTLAWGKPIGHSCHVRKGKILFSFYVNEANIADAKEAARKASTKFSIACGIETIKCTS